MSTIWNDPAVVAAIITSLGSILASTIAALAAFMVGKKFLNQQSLRERLGNAIGDIHFLLAVEDLHCKERMEGGETSLKLQMRAQARDQGLAWSGRFTPGRVRQLAGE